VHDAHGDRGRREALEDGADPRAFLFLMDYASRQRIKMWGRARVVPDDRALLERLAPPGSAGRPEQAIVLSVDAWDRNCPQYIPRRLDAEPVERELAALRERIDHLERENQRLREAGA
jgi:hypothetical protein